MSDTMSDTMNEEKAMIKNQGKPKWSLLYYPAIEGLVRVLEFGLQKYSKDNWKFPMSKEESLESMQRHLVALFNGEENDQESGLHHVLHLMARAMFYYYHATKNSFYDNN